MTSRPVAAHDLQALWQRLPTTPVVITPAEMRKRAEAFQAHIRRRNRTEYGAWLFVSAVLVWMATWPISLLWSVACVALLLGGAYAVFELHRRGAASVVPDGPTLSLLDFHRTELARQRDTLRGMWRWYLLPILPGVALFGVAWWMAISTRVPQSIVVLKAACVLLFAVLVVGWTIVVQLSGAARLQRLIEDMDRYRE